MQFCDPMVLSSLCSVFSVQNAELAVLAKNCKNSDPVVAEFTVLWYLINNNKPECNSSGFGIILASGEKTILQCRNNETILN